MLQSLLCVIYLLQHADVVLLYCRRCSYHVDDVRHLGIVGETDTGRGGCRTIHGDVGSDRKRYGVVHATRRGPRKPKAAEWGTGEGTAITVTVIVLLLPIRVAMTCQTG